MCANDPIINEKNYFRSFCNTRVCLPTSRILLHVVANLICMFLDYRQLVLLSPFPKFLHSFCEQHGCPRLIF